MSRVSRERIFKYFRSLSVMSGNCKDFQSFLLNCANLKKKLLKFGWMLRFAEEMTELICCSMIHSK